MTKSEIATVLEEVAALLELKGENPFKIRAYTNAARSIETFGGNVSNLQDEEALSKIPGIGKSIAEKIKELAATGSLKYLEELRTEFPAAILELFSISGLGAKKIKALYDQLQVSSIEQLRRGMRNRPRREIARLWRNNTNQDLQSDRGTSKTFRFLSIRADRRRSRNNAERSRRTSRCSPGRCCGQLSASKRNCARSRSGRGHKKSRRSDYEIFRRPSAGRIDHRTGPDEIECATSFGCSMRSASSELGGISFCAGLFHRKQGAQHRAAQPRARTRLDA